MNSDTTTPTSPSSYSRRAQFAWCTFDFANSAFPTVALTAFGAPFFISVLVGDAGLDLGFVHLGATTAWGLALGLSMALVTLTAPLLGAVADRTGRKKTLLSIYVGLCVAATLGLGFLPPGSGLWAFGLYVVANFAFEGAYVFYNSFLPELAPQDRLGRLSGTAWAFGYIGGLLALVLCYPLVPKEYHPDQAGAASMVYVVISVWYLVFSVPALLWLPKGRRPVLAETDSDGASLFRDAFGALLKTLREVRKFHAVVFFLAAFFLYNDGITTVIQFVGVFTKETLAFSPTENLQLFLVLNLVAAPGALFFGRVLDRIGGKRTLMWNLVLWLVVVGGAAFSHDRASFWPVAGLAAVVIGATQACSRALMARLAPADRVGQFMGLLSLSGKASAVIGPLAYGLIVDATVHAGEPISQGHRYAILFVGLMFLVALFLLSRMDENAGVRAAQNASAAS